jgi:hypothetical protein
MVVVHRPYQRSVWSVDLFRYESFVLRSYRVLVVMDHILRKDRAGAQRVAYRRGDLMSGWRGICTALNSAKLGRWSLEAVELYLRVAEECAKAGLAELQGR